MDIVDELRAYIVDELRAWPARGDGSDGMSSHTVGEIMEAAAAEIERLRIVAAMHTVGEIMEAAAAEIERLRIVAAMLRAQLRANGKRPIVDEIEVAN